MTITAGDLTAVEDAWTRWLGYRVVDRGRIAARTARGWQAPTLAGRGYVVLAPASGEPTFVRFVEQPTPAGFDASGTYGWNTTEITIQDTDRLHERLRDSPFRLRFAPMEVPTYPYVRQPHEPPASPPRLRPRRRDAGRRHQARDRRVPGRRAGRGRPCATLSGAAGELLELVQA